MGVSPTAADSARKAPPADRHWTCMDRDAQLKRLRYLATHRGTREADMLIGGFFEAHHAGWSEGERAMFAAMLEERDADILAWAFGAAAPPARFNGPMMEALQRLDFIPVRR